MTRTWALLLLLLLFGSAIGGLLSWIGCKLTVCCDAPYIKPNFEKMGKDLEDRLFGQHIVRGTVIPSIQSHFTHKNTKPLVLSFNGMTGTGKNHVARIIADNIYWNGLGSKFVHHIHAVAQFPDKRRLHQYRAELQALLINSVRSCGRTMFIFDEVDKLPEQLLDSIKPFLDYNDKVMGVDFRDAIFVFLSNHGGDAIAQVTANHRANGKPRNKLRAADFEKSVTESVYYGEGGLQKSQLISNNLIDHYIPFLPLERQHARQCILVYLNTRDVVAARDESFIEEILHKLLYFPASDPVFSKSGCKRLEQLSDVALTEWRARRFVSSGKAGKKDHDEM